MRLAILTSIVLISCGDNASEGAGPYFTQLHTETPMAWASPALAYPFGLYVVDSSGAMSRWALDGLTDTSLKWYGSTAGTDWVAADGFYESLQCLHRDGTLWGLGVGDPEGGNGCLTLIESGPWRSVSGRCRIALSGALWCNEIDIGLVRVGVENDWDRVSSSLVGATCAIKADRSLWCWGRNQHGEVGDGTTEPRASPVRVGATDKWLEVAARRDHTCGLRSDGALLCWGSNALGALGQVSETGYESLPRSVGVDRDWTRILDAYCAVKRDRELWCWGEEFGNEPRRVPSGDEMRSLAYDGGNITCGVKADASLWCATLRVSGWF